MMEKYKRLYKVEEIKKYADEGKFEKAMQVLQTINVNKVKKYEDLVIIADVYINNKKYYEAKKLLDNLCNKSITRRVLTQLIFVSLKLDNYVEVEKYYEQYVNIAPNDISIYIYRYKIDKEKNRDFDTLIETLEKIKEYEYIEEWEYELAKLYYKAGYKGKCIKECSDIILWFSEGSIVEKAKILREYLIRCDETTGQSEKEFSPTEKLSEIMQKVKEIIDENDESEEIEEDEDDLSEIDKVLTFDIQNDSTSSEHIDPNATDNIKSVARNQIEKVKMPEASEDNKDLPNDKEVQEVINEGLEETEEVVEIEEEPEKTEEVQEIEEELEITEEIKEMEEEPKDKEEDQKTDEEFGKTEDIQIIEETEETEENINEFKEDKEQLDVMQPEDRIETNEQDNKRTLSDLKANLDKILKIDIENSETMSDMVQSNNSSDNRQNIPVTPVDNMNDMLKVDDKKKDEKSDIGDIFNAISNSVNSIIDDVVEEYVEAPDRIVGKPRIGEEGIEVTGTEEYDEYYEDDDYQEDEILEYETSQEDDQYEEYENFEDDYQEYEEENYNEYPEEKYEDNYEESDEEYYEDEEYTNDEGYEEYDEEDYAEYDSDEQLEGFEDNNGKENSLLNPDIFCNYYEIESLNKNISDCIYNLQINMVKANFVISGPDFSGRTTIARMIAKQLHDMGYIGTNRIARITGEVFNRVNLIEKAEKLLDGCIIIQKAENVTRESYDELIKLISYYPGRLVVFLETSQSIEELTGINEDLHLFFTSIVQMPKYKLEDLVEFAHSYAAMDEFYISESAEGAIRKCVNNSIQEKGYAEDLSMIIDLIDRLIENASKRLDGRQSDTNIIERQDVIL